MFFSVIFCTFNILGIFFHDFQIYLTHKQTQFIVRLHRAVLLFPDRNDRVNVDRENGLITISLEYVHIIINFT